MGKVTHFFVQLIIFLVFWNIMEYLINDGGKDVFAWTAGVFYLYGSIVQPIIDSWEKTDEIG